MPKRSVLLGNLRDTLYEELSFVYIIGKNAVFQSLRQFVSIMVKASSSQLKDLDSISSLS